MNYKLTYTSRAERDIKEAGSCRKKPHRESTPETAGKPTFVF